MTDRRLRYPFRRDTALGVPEEIRDLRSEPVVPVTLPSGDPAVLVTRYADVRSVLTDPRLSRNLARPGAPRMTAGNPMFQDPEIDPDPPEHTRVRRLLAKAFTATRVETMRPHVREVAEELLAVMAERTPPVDLNEAFAFPLTMRVVCDLLGVPLADQELFRAWTDRFFSVGRFGREEIGRAFGEMNQYMRELIAAKRREPADDLVSAMVAVHDHDDGRLNDYELHWWCRLLLLVGYETTATQLGGSVAMLLTESDQLALLRNDLGVVPDAVEELLRWKLVGGSSLSMLRYATADLEVGGVTISAGTGVIPIVESANRDETVFSCPETFDVTRTDNPHITFSIGPHFCLGAALARVELQVALELLLSRFPTLRLAVPADELRRHDGALLEGFVSVPVEW
ncbi:cytochrome P450 [Amycolatopsis rubida]|uniref:Cytochrome P450 n=1 Tax=Amycolatopsis rubida TaxID=112413 RepID=A0A1I5TIU5_9PSEU|nr:cytochrome P450 [Amycolatopsis rubida]SFP82953.1 Cytochrome P450 [Amycolatopsis rubida]